MKNALRTVMFGGVVVCLIAAATFTVAQDRGGRGNFDPEEMRARMMERYQEVLGFSDDEWKAVSPLVTAVMEKQQQGFRGGGFRIFGGPGGGRGGEGGGRRGGGRGFGGGEPDPATTALADALEDDSASADSIKAKLTAVRDARKKQEKELQVARENLRKVLNIRQEAQLVLTGMLD